MKKIISKRQARHKRLRTKIKGTAEKPRLSVFRSNRHIFAQLIDDAKGITIASASDVKIAKKIKKTESAKMVGVKIAETAKEKNIKKIMFDRGGYKYHGRTKAVAEGAREGGLKF